MEVEEVKEVEHRDARAGDRDDGKFPDDARSLAMRKVHVKHVDKKNHDDERADLARKNRKYREQRRVSKLLALPVVVRSDRKSEKEGL